MRSALSFIPVLVLCGCAAPFVEVPSTRPSSGKVRASHCGNSGMRASSVIAAMDGPPLGETGSQSEAPKEVEVCVLVDNQGSQPVKVDRTRVYLKAPHETETPIPDKDDDRFVVPAGTSRKFKVAFHYSSVLSGEDVRLDFKDVVSENGHALDLPPIVLRRR